MKKAQHRVVCKLSLVSDVMKIGICFTVVDLHHSMSPREVQKVADTMSDAVSRAIKEVPEYGGENYTITSSRFPY